MICNIRNMFKCNKYILSCIRIFLIPSILLISACGVSNSTKTSPLAPSSPPSQSNFEIILYYCSPRSNDATKLAEALIDAGFDVSKYPTSIRFMQNCNFVSWMYIKREDVDMAHLINGITEAAIDHRLNMFLGKDSRPANQVRIFLTAVEPHP